MILQSSTKLWMNLSSLRSDKPLQVTFEHRKNHLELIFDEARVLGHISEVQDTEEKCWWIGVLGILHNVLHGDRSSSLGSRNLLTCNPAIGLKAMNPASENL